MINEHIRFEGAHGDTLSARVSRPPGAAAGGTVRAWALFAHCFTCSKDLKAAVNISRALVGQGFGVLRFDFTGLGESEGDFADTTFSSNIDDLLVAGRHMADAPELGAPAILVGHSLGGAAVLKAAGEMPSVKAVATIGAPFDPEHVKHLFDDAKDEIMEEGLARVRIGGRPFTVRREFIEDLATHEVERAIGELGRPLMVFHSPIDNTVGVENAALIFQAARHPRSYVSLDTADHLLTDPADSWYVGSVLGAWARRYMEEGEEAGASEGEVGEGAAGAEGSGADDHLPAARSDRGGVVARTGAEGYRTEVRARQHALVADEPESVGGEDLGPTPYELLSAALAVCSTMTLRMYADRKGWPLEEAEFTVEHSKMTPKEAEAAGEVGGAGGVPRLDLFRRELVVRGELDQAQRERLLEIADRCPVHRSLSAGVRIESALGEG
ncbi:MAG: OsmC family protein [Gemmatimonadales bacterium]|nr:MAG: OsmC family protein [Gemmatimonadales bacterium]